MAFSKIGPLIRGQNQAPERICSSTAIPALTIRDRTGTTRLSSSAMYSHFFPALQAKMDKGNRRSELLFLGAVYSTEVARWL